MRNVVLMMTASIDGYVAAPRPRRWNLQDPQPRAVSVDGRCPRYDVELWPIS